jgi:uncharacterized membrane protein
MFQAYWMFFAALLVLDFCIAEAVMESLPAYWLLKVIFMLYLCLPKTRGAEKLYVNYVAPAVTSIEAKSKAIAK